jgi:hypothetical protein
LPVTASPVSRRRSAGYCVLAAAPRQVRRAVEAREA